jgi:nitrite reductase/ring-hydroxylating ferredoxin subunit
MTAMRGVLVSPEPAPGEVVRAGPWTVTNVDGEFRAVSSRCRHQLADLSNGWLDRNGCLVCPWHYSAYDLDTGRMTRGPQGFLLRRGHIPLYDTLVKASTVFLPLRRRRVVRARDGRLYVR